MDHLPDDITREILTAAIEPRTMLDTVLNWSSEQPVIKPKAIFLLTVCKTWLRIATPLIYNAIILTTKTQAQALAMSVKADKPLGSCIKHLMVCGGFGKFLKQILSSCSHLHTISLTLDLDSGDSETGLVSGLKLINPTQAVLQNTPNYQGPLRRPAPNFKCQDAVLCALRDCVENVWTNLVGISWFQLEMCLTSTRKCFMPT